MDKEKEYNREEKRLKQKYRNVLRQLEHEQKIELNSFVKTHNQLLAGPVLL